MTAQTLTRPGASPAPRPVPPRDPSAEIVRRALHFLQSQPNWATVVHIDEMRSILMGRSL